MKIARLLILLVPFWLGACATVPDEPQSDKSDQAEAKQLINQGEYEAALEKYDEIRKATNSKVKKGRAEMGKMYTWYKMGDYRAVLKQGQKILEDYPGHPELAYVLYLRAMSWMQLGEKQLETLLSQMPPGKQEPDMLRSAYSEFVKLIKAYPQTGFSSDAYKQLPKIQRELARYELYLARYELIDGRNDEVLRHSRYIIEYYKDPWVEQQALALMKKAYIALKQPEQAKKIQARIQLIKDSAASLR